MRNLMRLKTALWHLAIVLLSLATPTHAELVQPEWPAKTNYKYEVVSGHKIFYREAGDPKKPTIVLLHGFPSSSHSYRELIPLLSGKFHVIAPDYLGSGYSEHPSAETTRYTFDLLADHVLGLLTQLNIEKYTLYIQDFGAPVGFRLMLKAPGSVRALIVQNGNAYLDGLTEPRQAFFKRAHEDRTAEGIASLYMYVSRDAVINKQYLRDVKGKEQLVSPDSWTHDLIFLVSEEDKAIQVQLFQDYYNNLLAYPLWQQFMREKKLPTLIVWGKNDPAFIVAGANAYLRDVPEAELHLLDAGHFAVEEKAVEIAQYIYGFMGRASVQRKIK